MKKKEFERIRKRSSSQHHTDINEFLQFQCSCCVDCKDNEVITKGGEFPERTTVIFFLLYKKERPLVSQELIFHGISTSIISC